MPIRWIQPRLRGCELLSNQSGFGDLQAVKIGLASSDTQSVTLQIRGIFHRRRRD
jgi:hypothetical protein